MRKIILEHFERYPKMQIQDMVKLIYQNVFAGGHLITDEKESLRHLKEEFSNMHSSVGSTCLSRPMESIGSNLYRLHLSFLKENTIKLDTVNRFFINTANSLKGDIDSLKEKLNLLQKMCKNKELSFSCVEVDSYLKEYEKNHYPLVSHSQIYRKEYAPSYRIVGKEYCRFLILFCRIDELINKKDVVTIAIDGNCAAGKSTLASIIHKVYNCNVFHMDDYFLTDKLRTPERLNEPGGNVDYLRFKNEIMNGLKSRGSFRYQKYDCSRGTMGEWVNVNPKKINIIEGSYSMHPTLSDNYDLKVFLHVDADKQSRRILKRNGKYMHKRFIEEWIPLENRYFNELKIKNKCDLVFA